MSLPIPAHRTRASQILNNSPTLPRSVTLTPGGRAGAGSASWPSGPMQVWVMDAPEQAIVGKRHGGIVVHADDDDTGGLEIYVVF